MKRIYLDYAASTTVDPAVFDAMKPYFSEKFGNPGSLHSFGQEAIAAVDFSREAIAKAIGAQFRELVFTGSATEANNLAVSGVIVPAYEQGLKGKARFIVSAIEHESILEAVRNMERMGVAEIIYLSVSKDGRVDPAEVKSSLNERTVLVSVMYANNEVGSIQPIKEIAEIIREFKKTGEKNMAYPLFHTDAAQAFQFLDCNPAALGVDLMTLSGHKICGPKGVGALYIKSGAKPHPGVFGGGQEFGLRSGTENVPAIVGFAKAVELALAAREKETKRLGELRDHFWSGLKKIFPDAEMNGGEASAEGVGGAETKRAAPDDKKTDGAALPNILNVYFPGREAQDILTKLDLHGVAASSGSACRSRALESSYVIEALGYGKERAKSSVRFSLGRFSTIDDIESTLKIMKLF